jgi:hypothetical protein
MAEYEVLYEYVSTESKEDGEVSVSDSGPIPIEKGKIKVPMRYRAYFDNPASGFKPVAKQHEQADAEAAAFVETNRGELARLSLEEYTEGREPAKLKAPTAKAVERVSEGETPVGPVEPSTLTHARQAPAESKVRE